jgi:hypothetical protein
VATSLLIAETNGPSASPTITDLPATGGVIQFASVDQPSTIANLSANNGISPGGRSFEKWLAGHVAVVAPTQFDSFSAQFSSSAPLDAGSNGNVTVKFGTATTYTTPTSGASAVATNPSVGQTTTLTPPANSVGALSNYAVLQLAFASGAILGDAVFPTAYLTFTYSYH